MTRMPRTLAALASAAAMASPPVAAAQPQPVDAPPPAYGSPPAYDDQGRPYDRTVAPRDARADRQDYDTRCQDDRSSSGNKGTVAGALVGGASGALIGGNLIGGLVGAGVGAVAGHQIAKNRVHC